MLKYNLEKERVRSRYRGQRKSRAGKSAHASDLIVLDVMMPQMDDGK